MNQKQRELARHALGLPNKKNVSNRNYFCLGVGCDDYLEWLDLVKRGLAIRRVIPHCGGDDIFHLTLEGALQARDPKEHISREDAAAMRKFQTTMKGNS